MVTSLYENRIEVYTMQIFREKLCKKEYYVSHNLRLCLISGGAGVWEIGGAVYPVETGDLVLLNNRHRRVFSEIAGEKLTITVIGFEPQMVINTPFAGLFFGEGELPVRIPKEPTLIELAKAIRQEEEEKKLHYRTVIGLKLYLLLGLICRQYDISADTGRIAETDMLKALAYIEENYTGDLSLTEAAERLHMSPTRFSRYFSDCMKIGFSRYVMQKRIYHALSLLRTTDKTVLEISLECGFHNPANFYKAFKKVTGGAPGDYRTAKQGILL